MDATRPQNGKPVKKDEKKQATGGVNSVKAAGATTTGGVTASRTPAPTGQLRTGGGKVAPQDARTTTPKPASLVKGQQPATSGQAVQQKAAEKRHASPARSSTGSHSRALEHVVPALQEKNFGPQETDKNGYPLYDTPGHIASIVQNAKKRRQELIAAGKTIHKGNKGKLPIHPKQAA